MVPHGQKDGLQKNRKILKCYLFNFNIGFSNNFTGRFRGQLSSKIARNVPLHTSAKNRKTFKETILNGWIDFEIISQECSLRDSTKIDKTVPFHRTRKPPELKKIEKPLNNF